MNSNVSEERGSVGPVLTSSPEETERMGERFAAELKGGELILLVGELGSGKTTFVRGLARRLGVDDPGGVASPSYTIINEYPGSRLTLHHADLYRLDDPTEIDDLALDELLSPDSVVVVEWGEKLPSSFGVERILRFRIRSANSREIIY